MSCSPCEASGSGAGWYVRAIKKGPRKGGPGPRRDRRGHAGSSSAAEVVVKMVDLTGTGRSE